MSALRCAPAALALTVVALATGGCSVENDEANEEVTLKYDRQRIEKAADDTEKAADAVATGVTNVATDTARAVKRQVGDIDVDVKVKRTPSDEQEAEQ